MSTRHPHPSKDQRLIKTTTIITATRRGEDNQIIIQCPSAFSSPASYHSIYRVAVSLFMPVVNPPMGHAVEETSKFPWNHFKGQNWTSSSSLSTPNPKFLYTIHLFISNSSPLLPLFILRLRAIIISQPVSLLLSCVSVVWAP